MHVVHLDDFGVSTTYLRYDRITAASGAWTGELVASVSGAAMYGDPWIALDGGNNPHALWPYYTNWGVIFHGYKAPSWTYTNVCAGFAPSVSVGAVCAFAINNCGYHFMFEVDDFQARTSAFEDLQTGCGANQTNIVCSTTGSGAAAITDSAGNIHVVLINDGTTRDLVYRKWTAASASWGSLETIHANVGLSVPDRAGIAIDGTGTIHVSYTDHKDADRPYYAVKSGAAWVVKGAIDTANTDMGWVRIACAPDNTPYVAYSDANNGYRLKYARYTGTNWSITNPQNLAASDNGGPDIAIDQNWVMHLIYGYQRALNYLRLPLVTNTVATSSWPLGGGTTGGGGAFPGGSSITVCATNSPCYNFVNWTEGGVAVSGSACYSFVVSSNRNLVANFANAQYTVAANCSPPGGGTTTGGGTTNCGSNVTVCATANPNYMFTNWTQNGVPIASSTCILFLVTSNCSLVANFVSNSPPPTPPNDDFSHRIALTGYHILATGWNTNATKEPGEPNHAGATGGKSVWWSWVPPVSGEARLSTFGGSYDTLLGLYVGAQVSNLVTIASNDDENGSLTTSLIVTNVTGGTDYAIAVDGYAAAFGSIVLSVDLTVPVVTVAPVAGQVVLSWSTNYAGFILESCTNLAPPLTWDVVSPPAVIVNHSYTVTNTPTEPASFFRLRKP